jgi:excisionase family DNA binding protein
MRIDLDQSDIQAIAQEVAKVLKPLFKSNGKAGSENDTLFTVESLAEYLGVSKRWVYERIHLKEIPYAKVGKFPRFRKSKIDRWIDSLETPAIHPLSRSLKRIK